MVHISLNLKMGQPNGSELIYKMSLTYYISSSWKLSRPDRVVNFKHTTHNGSKLPIPVAPDCLHSIFTVSLFFFPSPKTIKVCSPFHHYNAGNLDSHRTGRVLILHCKNQSGKKFGWRLCQVVISRKKINRIGLVL
ncbi:hypothetical protein K501DRAFT_273974 [Backusella circina FSU 941]|nr:hypothetical protein K501DRAFT_273974 [Backusella circina FSU 941]